jgi:hypothetical protein
MADNTKESVLEDWLNAKETADWLGVTSRSLSSNRIPSATIGGIRVYNKTDVAKWLEQRRDGVNR